MPSLSNYRTPVQTYNYFKNKMAHWFGGYLLELEEKGVFTYKTTTNISERWLTELRENRKTKLHLLPTWVTHVIPNFKGWGYTITKISNEEIIFWIKQKKNFSKWTGKVIEFLISEAMKHENWITFFDDNKYLTKEKMNSISLDSYEDDNFMISTCHGIQKQKNEEN